MYKNIFIVIVVFLFVGCGGPKSLQQQITETVGDFSEIADPGEQLVAKADALSENGGVAVVGEGQANRMDIAKEKARLDGEIKISQALEQKVTSLRKKAVENIGQGEADDELNEAFTSAGKSASSGILKGVVVKERKLAKRKDGVFYAWALVVINPKIVNSAIIDEVKKKSIKTYERIRTSQLFDELKEEEAKFDKKAKELETE